MNNDIEKANKELDDFMLKSEIQYQKRGMIFSIILYALIAGVIGAAVERLYFFVVVEMFVILVILAYMANNYRKNYKRLLLENVNEIGKWFLLYYQR